MNKELIIIFLLLFICFNNGIIRSIVVHRSFPIPTPCAARRNRRMLKALRWCHVLEDLLFIYLAWGHCTFNAPLIVFFLVFFWVISHPSFDLGSQYLGTNVKMCIGQKVIFLIFIYFSIHWLMTSLLSIYSFLIYFISHMDNISALSALGIWYLDMRVSKWFAIKGIFDLLINQFID